MAELPGRIGTLTARDVMTCQVIVVHADDSITQAIGTFRENRITGAPVVDATGRFIGILSIRDLLREPGVDAEQITESEEPFGDATWALFEKSGRLEHGSESEQVVDRMSANVATVGEGLSLVEVARTMCSGHWHRVPVIDESGNLTGIISTMDVLAALVNSADELR